jgi:hypothetical protein
VNGDTGCGEIRHNVVLPRQHVRDFVVESLVISLGRCCAQQSFRTTRSKALHKMEDADALVNHRRTPLRGRLNMRTVGLLFSR